MFFFQGTCLQSSHFPSFSSPIIPLKFIIATQPPARRCGKSFQHLWELWQEGMAQDRPRRFRNTLGSLSGILPSQSGQALESVLPFTGCTFWQCFLIKKGLILFFLTILVSLKELIEFCLCVSLSREIICDVKDGTLRNFMAFHWFLFSLKLSSIVISALNFFKPWIS